MDEYSESLRKLNSKIAEGQIDKLILDPEEWGDILLVENVQLETQFRGYGIGLLAVKELIDQVSGASEGWTAFGTIVVDASGLDSDLEPGRSRREVQDKLIRHWQLLGLRVLVEKKWKRRCTFVGDCLEGYSWPGMAKVVPHLITPNTLCDTANVDSTAPNSLEELDCLLGIRELANFTTLKRGRGFEELNEPLGDSSARKHARMH
jgi:hypothetical protein